MPQIGIDGLPLTAAGDLKRRYAVIQFQRAVKFPRFSMAASERWGFVVYGKTSDMLEAIRGGQRFEFAGGQGVPGDAVIIYEGHSGLEFSRAAGYIQAEAAR